MKGDKIDYCAEYHRVLAELTAARQQIKYLEPRCKDLENANTKLLAFNATLLQQRDKLNAQLSAREIKYAREARGEGYHA